jgi:hypothetical protein
MDLSVDGQDRGGSPCPLSKTVLAERHLSDLLIVWAETQPKGPKTRGACAPRVRGVVFYAVVSDEIEQVIEFFVDREDAETMLARVLVDEPEWEDTMRVEPVELARGGLN